MDVKLYFKLLIFFVTLHESFEISCDFIDTVNITAGSLNHKGNYVHNRIVYTKEFYATFDYIIDRFDGKRPVAPHIRGCICKLKPCIRVCCRETTESEADCVKNNDLIVPTRNRAEEIDLLSEKFAIIDGWPCELMYDLEPEENDYDEWIFEVNNRKKARKT